MHVLSEWMGKGSTSLGLILKPKLMLQCSVAETTLAVYCWGSRRGRPCKVVGASWCWPLALWPSACSVPTWLLAHCRPYLLSHLQSMSSFPLLECQLRPRGPLCVPHTLTLTISGALKTFQSHADVQKKKSFFFYDVTYNLNGRPSLGLYIMVPDGVS